MTLDIETLQIAARELEEYGIYLDLDRGLEISPEAIPEIIADKDLFYAKLHGVSKTLYIDYANKVPMRCSGTTKKKRRCKHLVNGAGADGCGTTIKDYASMAGGYCVFHGG